MTRMMNGRDWTTLIILSILWGGSFFFIELGIRALPPMTVVLIRVALAALALWVYLLARRRPLVMPRTAWPAFLLLALLNNVLPFLAFAWGQTQIASGLASILNATTPLWGVLVAHAFTRDERITPAKIVGLLLGFGGVAAMIGADLLANIGDQVLAQLACLGATLCYALAGVHGRRFRTMGVPPVSVATAQLTASTMVMIPLVLAFEGTGPALDASATAWAALAALALFSTAVAYILYFRLIASAGATNALLVTFLIPITAILLGVAFLGEIFEGRHLTGMALIGLGLACIDGRLASKLRLRPL